MFRTLRGHKISLGTMVFERMRQVGSQSYLSFSADRLSPSRLLMTQADNKNTSLSISYVPLHVVPHHSKTDIHSASHSQCQINNSDSTIIQLIVLQVLCRFRSSSYRWGHESVIQVLLGPRLRVRCQHRTCQLSTFVPGRQWKNGSNATSTTHRPA